MREKAKGLRERLVVGAIVEIDVDLYAQQQQQQQQHSGGGRADIEGRAD